MNICEFIIENKIPHTKLEDGRIQQNCVLYLWAKQISSLDGFVQNGELYLWNNQISSLDGFVQSGTLNLSHNQISSLDGFVQNGVLHLSHNQIKNTNTTFINPKTNRVVFKMNEDWFGCGCFLGNKQQLKETCLEQGFLEIIEYFNL